MKKLSLAGVIVLLLVGFGHTGVRGQDGSDDAAFRKDFREFVQDATNTMESEFRAIEESRPTLAFSKSFSIGDTYNTAVGSFGVYQLLAEQRRSSTWAYRYEVFDFSGNRVRDGASPTQGYRMAVTNDGVAVLDLYGALTFLGKDFQKKGSCRPDNRQMFDALKAKPKVVAPQASARQQAIMGTEVVEALTGNRVPDSAEKDAEQISRDHQSEYQRAFTGPSNMENVYFSSGVVLVSTRDGVYSVDPATCSVELRAASLGFQANEKGVRQVVGKGVSRGEILIVVHESSSAKGNRFFLQRFGARTGAVISTVELKPENSMVLLGEVSAYITAEKQILLVTSAAKPDRSWVGLVTFFDQDGSVTKGATLDFGGKAPQFASAGLSGQGQLVIVAAEDHMASTKSKSSENVFVFDLASLSE